MCWSISIVLRYRLIKERNELLGHPVVETKWRLKDRFNEHRRAVDKTNIKSKPTTVSKHFLFHSNHSHTDMQLIPLEKIRSSRDSVGKARESHLIDKAMTLEPHGLNRRDELL